MRESLQDTLHCMSSVAQSHAGDGMKLRCLAVVAICVFAVGTFGQGAHKVKKIQKKARVKTSKSQTKRAQPRREVKEDEEAGGLAWMYSQRAQPLGYIPTGMQAEGVRQIRLMEVSR